MLMLDSRVVETSVNGKRKSEQPVSRSVEGLCHWYDQAQKRFYLIMNVHGQ